MLSNCFSKAVSLLNVSLLQISQLVGHNIFLILEFEALDFYIIKIFKY